VRCRITCLNDIEGSLDQPEVRLARCLIGADNGGRIGHVRSTPTSGSASCSDTGAEDYACEKGPAKRPSPFGDRR